MSLTAVRPFFRARMNAIGFTEHFDAFDDANRAQNKLEKLYRIDSVGVAGTPADQQVHEFVFDVSLVVTLRGKGNKNIALSDRAVEVLEEINAEILKTENRVGTDIKDIRPTTTTFDPYSPSDDNDLIMVIGFEAIIYCDFT